MGSINIVCRCSKHELKSRVKRTYCSTRRHSRDGKLRLEFDGILSGRSELRGVDVGRAHGDFAGHRTHQGHSRCELGHHFETDRDGVGPALGLRDRLRQSNGHLEVCGIQRVVLQGALTYHYKLDVADLSEVQQVTNVGESALLDSLYHGQVGVKIVDTSAHSAEAVIPVVAIALHELIVGHGLEGKHGVAELHRLEMALHVGSRGG